MDKKLRQWTADYIALTSFNTLFLGLGEYVIIGLNPAIILKTRAFAAILNLANGFLYGLFRKFWAGICMTYPDSSSLRKLLTDTSSNVIYGTSFYIIILFISGVDVLNSSGKILIAMIFAFASGRLYGRYHDFIRSKFKVRPILEK